MELSLTASDSNLFVKQVNKTVRFAPALAQNKQKIFTDCFSSTRMTAKGVANFKFFSVFLFCAVWTSMETSIWISNEHLGGGELYAFGLIAFDASVFWLRLSSQDDTLGEKEGDNSASSILERPLSSPDLARCDFISAVNYSWSSDKNEQRVQNKIKHETNQFT